MFSIQVAGDTYGRTLTDENIVFVFVRPPKLGTACGLLILSEGGGNLWTNPGEINQLTVETIYQELKDFLEQPDSSANHQPLRSDSKQSEDYLSKRFRLAIEKTNQVICEEQASNKSKVGITLVSTLIYGNVAVVANIGIKRAYHLHNKLNQITEDHSLYKAQLQEGSKTPEELDNLSFDSRIIPVRHLGDDTFDIDIFTQLLEPGDQLLLCDYGMWSKLSDAELERQLLESDDPEVIVERLMKLVMSDLRSNASVILARLTTYDEASQATMPKLIFRSS